MPIKMTTPMAEINAYLKEQTERSRRAIVRSLEYIGEICVNQARTMGNYTDRTGNLRSSVGYVIVADGRIVRESSFGSKSEGAEQGAEYAKTIARQFPRDFVLIVVAGMNYATYVAAKGFDVLDSAELLADKLVPQILKQLGF